MYKDNIQLQHTNVQRQYTDITHKCTTTIYRYNTQMYKRQYTDIHMIKHVHIYTNTHA